MYSLNFLLFKFINVQFLVVFLIHYPQPISLNYFFISFLNQKILHNYVSSDLIKIEENFFLEVFWVMTFALERLVYLILN